MTRTSPFDCGIQLFSNFLQRFSFERRFLVCNKLACVQGISHVLTSVAYQTFFQYRTGIYAEEKIIHLITEHTGISFDKQNHLKSKPIISSIQFKIK